MTLELRSELFKRKFPRLFLVSRPSANVGLQDVFLLWPDRTQTPVLDLSDAGILILNQGAPLKLGQVLEVKLKLAQHEPKTVLVKVLRLTKETILLALDSLTLKGRSKVEQDEREILIRASWTKMPTQDLTANFQSSDWWHSVFDTNIWIWRDSAGVLQKMILEFETVALIYDSQGLRFVKAPSAFDETKGYAGPLDQPLPNKVEPGHNWRDRLHKMLKASVLPEKLIAEIQSLLPPRPASYQPHV